MVRALAAQWAAILYVVGVSFGVNVLVARMFGPESFGLYAVALATGGILAVVIDGGFGKLVLRERVRGSPGLGHIGTQLPGYAFGHAITVVAVALAAGLVALPGQRVLVLATVLCFGATVLYQFGLAVMRGDGRMLRDAFWQIGNRSLTAVFIAAALLLGASEPWHVLVAQFIGGLVVVLSVMRYLRIRVALAVPFELYRAVWPLLWLDLALVTYFRAGMVLLEWLDVMPVDIGHYGVAYRLVEAVLLLVSPVGVMLFRRFRTGSGADSPASAKVWVAAAAGLAAGCAIAVMGIVGGGMVVQVFFGEAYAASAPLLAVLAGAFIFMFPNVVLIQAALALELERRCALIATIVAAFNIFVNLKFVPIYGAVAAAWATVASEALFGALIAAAIIRSQRAVRQSLEAQRNSE